DGQPSPLRSRLASRSCHSASKTRVNALVAAKAGGGCSTARTSLSLQTWEKQGDFSEMQGAPGVWRLRTTQSQWLGWILPIAGAGRVLFLSRENQRIAHRSTCLNRRYAFRPSNSIGEFDLDVRLDRGH